MSLPVREDQSGWTAGVPVGLPRPPPDSYVQNGEALNASKREAAPKISRPRFIRSLADDQFDRPQVAAR